MIDSRTASRCSCGAGRICLRGLIYAVGGWLGSLVAFLSDLAQELADENAYSRHLSWHRRSHSRAEWKAFYDSRLARKYQQGKCC